MDRSVHFTIPGWQERARAKRDAVISLIPPSWLLKAPLPSPAEQKNVTGAFIHRHLSPREVQITETDAVDIVRETCTGRWKAREVTEAFCHRASLAHQMTNCLHEIFFQSALADAERLDAHFAATGKPLGPLHGLPVSLKDQFHVQGVDSTLGYVGWIDTFEGKQGTGREKVFESEMTQELRRLGAVLFCKTSLPHAVMSAETVNNIIGYTWNPSNRHLSAGGSSGGEGALLACKGSPAGIGTDLGGSVRIPAAFNGLYGLLPSPGRLSCLGVATSMDGQNSTHLVPGPLSHSLKSLRLLVRSFLSLAPWLHDPLVLELPWRTEQEQQILDLVKGGTMEHMSFGVLMYDGGVMPQPPVRRAVDTVRRALEAQGCKIVEWKPPSHARAYEIALNSWKYDGGKDINQAFSLSGEPMSSQIAAAYGTMSPESTGSEIAQNNIAKREYEKEYMDYWNSTAEISGTGRPVTAIIAPVAPFPAARPETFNYYAYTAFVNVLGYTSCVIPVTTADKTIDSADLGYAPTDDFDRKVYESYDPEMFDGTPVGAQIIGRRLQEEKILAVAELVAAAVHGRGRVADEKL